MTEMWIPVIVAVVTGIFTVVGVIITSKNSLKEITHKLETQQAVTDTKIENLTQEVHNHNNFAVKIPVLENRITTVELDIKEIKKELASK